MEKGLVSVVMPVFNSARFLREALASVVSQSYAALEVMAVDGPSTDATAEIVASFPRARYLRQSGSGMWNAVNDGIDVARGEFVAFLSGDDLWHPDKLRLQVEALRQHPEIQYVGGHMRFVPVEGNPPPPSFRTELFEGVHEGYMPEALLVRRRLFDTIGRFDEKQQISADIDWLVRARDARVGRLAVPEVVLYKRAHGDNLSTHQSTGPILHRELLTIIRQSLVRRRDGSTH